MSDTNSYVILCLICGIPYLAGVISTLVVAGRVARLGWWGVLPFGGTIKNLIDERQG